jgi:hypothetical protein
MDFTPEGGERPQIARRFSPFLLNKQNNLSLVRKALYERKYIFLKHLPKTSSVLRVLPGEPWDITSLHPDSPDTLLWAMTSR